MKKSKEQISYNMSRVKSKDSQIELVLRKSLWGQGFRYRKNWKELPGKPDIVITKHKIAIFCDSEFFHGKDWELLKEQLNRGSNPDFWIAKISRNMERDREVDRQLRALGWTPVRFWGKEIKKNTDECVRTIKELINEKELEAFDDV